MSILLTAQPRTDPLLRSVVQNAWQPSLSEVINRPLHYRCQIIYTQIDRNKKNRPTFTHHYFNYDPQLYFNPASMVKMPLAFLALEKLHHLNKAGVNEYTPIQIDSLLPHQTTAYTDPTSEKGLPSIAHYIKKAFLVSDNDAYNRLYQFVGQQAINRSLHNKGYTQSRIIRQFMGLTTEQNRHTNPVRFLGPDGNPIFTQPALYNTDSISLGPEVKIGRGYLNRNDELVNEPFDFTPHNHLPLSDLQQMLQSVLFPASVPPQQRFNISNEQRRFLLQYLSQTPGETNYPKYNPTEYYDSYVKFFFRDSTGKLPKGVRVFNKVGWAYGFMTDVSYVADFNNGIEYMLAATIYVNEDGILNDNRYEYEQTGQPFMFQLGQAIYNYEKQRKRKFAPNLSEFKVPYETRQQHDGRPLVSGVDN